MWLTLEGTRNGTDLFVTTIRLDPTDDPYAERRAEVIKKLGERWVCDRARHVPRGQYEQRESHGADVVATWAAYRGKVKPSRIIFEGEI
jgi:hypothetical protein